MVIKKRNPICIVKKKLKDKEKRNQTKIVNHQNSFQSIQNQIIKINLMNQSKMIPKNNQRKQKEKKMNLQIRLIKKLKKKNPKNLKNPKPKN